ncbi:DUF2628 domain-containing protein [Consotaella aegiceratis]|uniref:DUF2628 domain-containing protein n=1 Tax=Consotaella aegiceratis TaxID=3097961 RepID=UPI002F3FED65
MTRYLVFEPPAGRPADSGAVFVRDRWSFWGLLFPLFWLLRYGLFISALCVFVIGLAISAASDWAGLDYEALALSLLVGLLVSLEGSSLRAWRYRRRGWRETAIVQAASLTEAEMSYYAGKSSVDQPDFVAVPPPPPFGGSAPRPTPPSLLDVPGRR